MAYAETDKMTGMRRSVTKHQGIHYTLLANLGTSSITKAGVVYQGCVKP